MALRKVKYEVTGMIGEINSGEGDIIEATLLLEEGNGSALLYHPRSKGNCASIEMAHDNGNGIYTADSKDKTLGWIDITRQRDLDTLVKNLSKLKYVSKRRQHGTAKKENSKV